MIPLKPRRLAALFNLFCLAWPLSASALQIVDVSDGVTAYAKIASDELTRISIADGRIASWYVPKGKLIIEKDAKGGQLYVRPLDRSAVVSHVHHQWQWRDVCPHHAARRHALRIRCAARGVGRARARQPSNGPVPSRTPSRS